MSNQFGRSKPSSSREEHLRIVTEDAGVAGIGRRRTDLALLVRDPVKGPADRHEQRPAARQAYQSRHAIEPVAVPHRREGVVIDHHDASPRAVDELVACFEPSGPPICQNRAANARSSGPLAAV